MMITSPCNTLDTTTASSSLAIHTSLFCTTAGNKKSFHPSTSSSKMTPIYQYINHADSTALVHYLRTVTVHGTWYIDQ